MQFPQPDERFSVVHIDLVGPLPPSDGYLYFLSMIDRYTNWMEAIPLTNITAETVAQAVYENWIVRFGIPSSIISDQGRQFEATLFKNLSSLCGIQLRRTTAYHPQCNGKAERLHRTLKTAIRANGSLKWSRTLPTVLLGLRAAFNPDSGVSIAEMVYGTTIKLPGEFLGQPAPISRDIEPFASIGFRPQGFIYQHACLRPNRSGQETIGTSIRWPLQDPGTSRKILHASHQTKRSEHLLGSPQASVLVNAA
ncbi:Reverse transcriptase (RNA-dependent DNA polymerase) [Nesidiocoris tenuis]|uniref:Reverse transcriptase (RNA-dependent DNA polymerase) n=1 Tax=Nesidiocoris tenuis TaxID=355587 RepID=A0ABN7AFE6_9HEMI|nr:Reverse transcriptase (RNA-dependent DNA polymerase) [Nesidiocoris tenuis]